MSRTTFEPRALNVPSPNDQNRLRGVLLDVSVKTTAWPTVGFAEMPYAATGAAPAGFVGSAVMTIANGSPEPLLMTEAKARTGSSLVNSIQRFVSVVPATPGNVPLSSRDRKST